MRNALLIAYAFPPCARSSGYLRPLALTHYLPQFGWQPFVLSAHPRAFEYVDHQLEADIPKHVSVTRAFALDTRRHLSIRGRYPLLLALPDRWWSWWLGAVPAGLRLVRRHRPALIWSTSPIISSHMIAWTLHRLTGIPWIADFRDPVSASGPDGSRLANDVPRIVERAALRHAKRCVFTTPGAAAGYADTYPVRRNDLVVIPNGYDERKFTDLSQPEAVKGTSDNAIITLVHSGLLYPQGRNPQHFFAAIAKLMEQKIVDASSLRIILRASGNEQAYAAQIHQYNLDEVVHLHPPMTYSKALKEQSSASGLLLFQGKKYNRQIPAKVYEYLRVGRPIFALTDAGGDTAALLRGEGVNFIAPLDDTEAIAERLAAFITGLREDAISVPPMAQVARFSREASTQRYAQLFDEVASGSA